MTVGPDESDATTALSPTTVAGSEDFRALFEAMPAACLVVVPDVPRFTIVAVTDIYCRRAQQTREALLGRGLFEAFPDAASPEQGGHQRRIEVALRDSFAEVCRTKVPHRMAVQRYDMPGHDGNLEPRYWQPINAPVVGPGGTVRYLVHQVEDVTDQRVAEAFQREMAGHLAAFNAQLTQNAEERERLLGQVRAEHQRSVGILESISDTFYAVDEQFRFTYVNRRAGEVWARNPRDLIGRHYWTEFPMAIGSESYEKHLYVMASRHPAHYETVSPILNRWIAVSIYPTEDGGLAVYFHDVEERKRADAEREAARAEAEAARVALEQAHAALEARVTDRTAALARSNEELVEEIAARERAEAERTALRRQLAATEEAERQRLARELHDRLGQHLTGFTLGLHDVRRRLSTGEPAEVRLTQLEELARAMTIDARALALELRPPELDDVGLESALETYVEDWAARYDISTEFAMTGTRVHLIPTEVASTLYRIVQEALTNVARHADATQVSVTAVQRDDEIRLAVEDDGRGFDVEIWGKLAPTERRLGLAGMRERAALVGGTVSIESNPGAGTTLYVRLPLGDADAAPNPSPRGAPLGTGDS